MIWVIIGCTVLIIVCLGGGMRLAKILLWVFAVIATAALAFAVPAPPGGGPTMSDLMGLILPAVGFFVVFAIGMRIKARYPQSWW